MITVYYSRPSLNIIRKFWTENRAEREKILKNENLRPLFQEKMVTPLSHERKNDDPPTG